RIVERFEETRRYQRRSFVETFPFARDGVRALRVEHVVRVVVEPAPLLGVERATADPVDDAQVVLDLIGAHLMEGADREREVHMTVWQQLELLRFEKHESGPSHLVRDGVEVAELPEAEHRRFWENAREIFLRDIERRRDVRDDVLALRVEGRE